MGSDETKSISELEKIVQFYSDFMLRVKKFEDLVDVGSKFLAGFQQGLDFLRKPPIDKASELVKCIIEANATRRLSSYVENGCVNTLDRVQNLNKLNTCQVGLLKSTSEAKDIVNELECLVKDVRGVVVAACENLPNLQHKDTGHVLDSAATTYDTELIVSSDLEQPKLTDYAAMMAVIYSMVKQDYLMQEKIVSSLNLKSSSEELESYCLMWSLRPFINDEVMHQAWSLIPRLCGSINFIHL